MRRRDPVKAINELAKQRGLTAVWVEGGKHSKVTVGTAWANVPRHREINELTARSILRTIEASTAASEEGPT